MNEYNNVFYFNHLNVIGGTESYFYYLARTYEDFDITIVYKTGDINQINRLKKYCRVKQFNGQKIKCKKAFFNYSLKLTNDTRTFNTFNK